MSHLTTHVLDAATGRPATGVGITLARVADSGEVTPIAEGVTDTDGRLALGPDRLEDGVHTLTFATGAYFAAREVETFYPAAIVTFTVAGDGHLHVPLLLSPFAYSTYRGS
ncbi:hydroxyisourate hydrolase [Microbacterium aurantiacum]|uniref:5-hydroxyisourate hydrolase n=1 Tax=Microbacterium aurantiacum TaxID=162393 RepID=A0ABT8FNC4_9MICO|nr:hydroxyisourate hydrolase [Microbacterium aurantiacum]MDN4462804.1 hydroxyisourate hydrolase [Microbacterium aurantiacum]